jgi:hypothetical protein
MLPDADEATRGEILKAEPRTLIWQARLGDGSRAVLKMYRHRRLFEVPPLHLGKLRVCREYDALSRLWSRRIACTEPLFWALGRDPVHGRFELLASREIEAAVELRSWIGSAGEDARSSALHAAFRSVRAMHASGVRHGGLSFKNLLVVPADAGPVFLADFARSVLFPSDIAGTRMAWFDLADLSRKVIAQFGSDACGPLLESYGLSRDEALRLMKYAERSRSTRHLRRRLRLEFRLRARWVRGEAARLTEEPGPASGSLF